MCISKIKNFFAKRRLKKVEVDPKGICMSIYCAKIILNCLGDNDIIYPYEEDLRYLHYQLHQDNPYYDYDERQEVAYEYLSITLNCSNGDFVKQRIKEEMENELGKQSIFN